MTGICSFYNRTMIEQGSRSNGLLCQQWKTLHSYTFFRFYKWKGDGEKLGVDFNKWSMSEAKTRSWFHIMMFHNGGRSLTKVKIVYFSSLTRSVKTTKLCIWFTMFDYSNDSIIQCALFNFLLILFYCKISIKL